MPPESGISPTASDTATIDIRRFTWTRRLGADYAYEFARLAPFFAGDPTSESAWRQIIGARLERGHPPETGEILATQLARRQAPAAALAAAERLSQAGTVAIVTGQQAGLFGGPLFTLLKAMTALRLAERVTAIHGVPSVAVFWIDAEDHDWDEVGTCRVLDGSLERHDVSLHRPDDAGERPVSQVLLDETVDETIDQLAAAVDRTEFTDELVAALRSAYRPGFSMTEAFGRWMDSLLGRHGLVVFDASDSTAKPLARQIFERELRHAGESSTLAAQAGEALRALGYHAQVTPTTDTVALFHLGNGRHAVRRSADGGFTIEAAVRRQADLLAELAASPEHFSPNVLLRPIVQDTLFPTACYVAGPSELAYLAQLKALYQHFETPMPLMYPRANATVVDSATARFLNRYQVPLEALQAQDEAALNRLLEAQLPASVDRSLEAAATAVRERMDALIAAVPSIDPTLAGAAKSTQKKMAHELRTLQNKIVQAAKRRDETLRRQFNRARAQAFPAGEPQERALGVPYLINRFGPSAVEHLLRELPIQLGVHALLTL